MQRQLLLDLKKNTGNAKVAAAYQESYPHNLEKSLYFTPQAQSSSTSGERAIQTGTAAIIGATGGIAAGIAYTAITGIEAFTRKLVSGNPEAYVLVSLEYLTFKQFSKNNNLPDADFKECKNLYYLAYEYQLGKEKRALFSANHAHDKIEDAKYFTVILIGHKLEKILTSPSKDAADLHKQHLQNFVKAVIKVDEVIETNSNDTTYLSLRTLLMTVQYSLVLEKNGEADNLLSAQVQIEQLITYYSQTQGYLENYIKTTKTHLQRLTTPFTAEEMITHQTKSNMSLVSYKGDTTTLLAQWSQFLQNKIELSNNQFVQSLVISSKLASIPEKFVPILQTVIDALSKLVQLHELTQKIVEVGNQQIAITLMLHELLILNKNIQTHLQECMQAIIQLNRFFLKEIYPRSTYQPYKTSLCQAVSECDMNTPWIAQVSDASFLVTQIIIHRKGIQEELAANLKNFVNELQTVLGTAGKHSLSSQMSDESSLFRNFEESMVRVNTIEELDDDSNWQLVNSVVSMPSSNFIEQQQAVKLEANNFLSFFTNTQLEEAKNQIKQLEASNQENGKRLQEQQNLVEELKQKLAGEAKNALFVNEKVAKLTESNTLFADTLQHKDAVIEIKLIVRQFKKLLFDSYCRLPDKNTSDNFERMDELKTLFKQYIYTGLKENNNKTQNYKTFISPLPAGFYQKKLYENYLEYLKIIPSPLFGKSKYAVNGLRHHLYSYSRYLKDLGTIPADEKKKVKLTEIFNEAMWYEELRLAKSNKKSF